MAELSQFDAELLAQDLPGLAQVAIASSIHSAERGQLEYRAAGSESNPTVLMLHGLGSSSAGYRAQFAGLSRDFRAIAWNAPGFGGSSPIAGHSASIDDYAEALEAFLRALRIERLSVLVGSSWGSVVALAFARRYPALVGSLVLSAPNVAKGRVVGEARNAERDAWLRMADISLPVSRAAIANRLLAPNSPSLVRRHVESLRDAMTTEGWRQAIRSLFTVHTRLTSSPKSGAQLQSSRALSTRSRRIRITPNGSSPRPPGRSRIRSKNAVTFSSSKLQ
jgi:pimeloyl-ACP methyl ester carboxylesterase